VLFVSFRLEKAGSIFSGADRAMKKAQNLSAVDFYIA
jgi:hypothetical protein